MSPAANCVQQCLRRFRTIPPVSALLRPGLNNVPVGSEIRVLASPFEARFIETCDLDQFAQVVRMARPTFFLSGIPLAEFPLRCKLLEVLSVHEHS